MNKKDIMDKQIDSLIKQAFQYETDWIEADLKGVDFEKIPEPTRIGWREVAREIKDHHSQTAKRYRIRRLKSLASFSVAALMFMVLLVDGGLEALGNKPYTYDGNGILYQESENEVIKFNNQDKLKRSQNEIIAYKEIADNMSIGPIKLGYRPEGMMFHKYILSERTVNMQFTYNNQFMYLDMNISSGNSVAAYTAEGTLVNTVRNSFLNVDTDIYEEEIDGGTKFIAVIVKGDVYSILSGVVPSDEFVKMVESLQY